MGLDFGGGGLCLKEMGAGEGPALPIGPLHISYQVLLLSHTHEYTYVHLALRVLGDDHHIICSPRQPRAPVNHTGDCDQIARWLRRGWKGGAGLAALQLVSSTI